MSKQNTAAEKKWKEIKEILERERHSPPSLREEVREQVAQKYEEFLNLLPLRLRKIYFVTLTIKPGVPTAVRRDNIPDAIRKYPEFYEVWAKGAIES